MEQITKGAQAGEKVPTTFTIVLHSKYRPAHLPAIAIQRTVSRFLTADSPPDANPKELWQMCKLLHNKEN